MKIVIVGLGVIGGSFAISLKNAGYDDVYGIDVNSRSIEKAVQKGYIKAGSADASQLLPDADLVIISLYPKLVYGFLKQYKPFFKDGAIVTDATGIKTVLIQEIKEVLPDNVDFVFGHPMAGREKKGIDYASSEVFQGANYILTPVAGNQPEHIEFLKEFVLSLGFGRVRCIPPELHDEMVGFTSQLPHAMAVALINSDREGRDTGSFIGDSYRDLTRIANINEELWSELFLGNKNNLLKAINDFEIELDMIKRAIHDDDKEALCAFFRKSSARREKL